MKVRFPLLLMFLLLGAGLIWKQNQAPAPETEEPSESSTSSFTPLLEHGVFEAKVLANVPSPNQGIVAEVREDATFVKPGDLLVRLDEEEIQNRIESEQLQLEQHQESLESEIQEIAVLTNQYARVARLEIAELKHAELRLTHAERPLPQDEERLLEIEIELAALDVSEAEEALSRQQELVKKSFAPSSSLEKPERDVETSRTYLEEKQSQLVLAKEPLPPEEILTRQSEVDKAQDQVTRSRSLHERELRIQRLKIEGARMNVEQSLARLEKLQEDLKEVRVTAPVEGLFLVIRKYSWGARRWQPLGVGSQVWGMNLVGQIVDPTDLHLRVLVHETDRERVRPGTRGEVHLTAFPGTSYPAKVQSITGVGQDRDDLSPVHHQAPAVNQALFLAILEVELPPDVPVKPGMTARILLSTGEPE